MAEIAESKKTDEKVQPRRARLSTAERLRAHPLKFLALLIFLVAAVIVGMRLWAYFGSYESTDDAQIDGNVYPVTSRIAGTATGVYVENEQPVKAGQLLVQLDPRDYAVAVDQANAELHATEAQVAVAQPNVPLTNVTTQTSIATAGSELESAQAQAAAAEQTHQSAVADLRSAEADNAKAQADLARYQQLVAKDEISKQQFDQAEANARAMAARVEARRAAAQAAARNVEAAQAKVQQARSRASEAQSTRPSQMAIQQAQVQSRRADVEIRKAQLEKAELNLKYTKIFAPVDGVIGRKSVSVGQQVSPGQQLMLDVPLEDVWVTANFKETQLKHMHPGQRATIHVDAYDRDLEGYVSDIAGASGSRFSLLPPENATGNYVKVVQRIPVRINLKPGQDPRHSLRPGMSVTADVWLDK